MLGKPPATTGPDGKTLGARSPPSCLSLFFNGPCAISGYITGDPTQGCCEGPALIVWILNILTLVGGSIYATCVWKPDPAKIKGDDEQRTVQNKCCAGCLLSGCEVVGFWQDGDLCRTPEGQCTWCRGDAGTACGLSCLGSLIGIPLGWFYLCCCWKENPQLFQRSGSMHGGGKTQGVVGQAVAVAQGMANQVIGQANVQMAAVAAP